MHFLCSDTLTNFRMSKKQTAASHCNTEASINSLDAGLRNEGSPTLNLLECVVDVLAPDAKSKFCTVHSRPDTIVHCTDHVPPNITSLSNRVQLIVDDNEAVNKMIIQCTSVNMRHVSNTHRVDLDGVVDECIRIQPFPFVM